MANAKLFVRERRKIEAGEKKPRYTIVGVAGTDLKIFAKHIRKMELDQIAAEIAADVVFLQAGKDEEGDDEDED